MRIINAEVSRKAYALWLDCDEHLKALGWYKDILPAPRSSFWAWKNSQVSTEGHTAEEEGWFLLFWRPAWTSAEWPVSPPQMVSTIQTRVAVADTEHSNSY